MNRSFALGAAWAVSLALVGYALLEIEGAWRAFDDQQLTLLDHARALDALAAARPPPAAEARALSLRAQDADLERAEAELARCLEDPSCSSAGPFEAADLALGSALRTRAAEREGRVQRAYAAAGVGGALVVAAGVALLLGARRARPGTQAGQEGPLSPGAGARPTPDEVRGWLEELYALRRRVAESDRFVALGEVAAGLSHGLKTPLAVVRAAAQTALVKLDDGHPATANLDDVIDGVDRLTAEVNRFLRASEAGAPTLVPVAPASLLEPLVARYGPGAGERDVRIVVAVDEGLPRIRADAALLGVALRNLVENALEATPEGSALHLAARRSDPPARAGLDRAAPAAGPFVEIVIEDEAGGLPAEVAAGARRTSRKQGGSGLGLAIARRAVERHGGALELEDTARGTRIRCRLPAEGTA